MIKSTKSGLFTYTRTLFEKPSDFVVYEMGGVFYMAALSSTIRVYNAKTFNLIFEGPSFRKRPKQIHYQNKRLYVASGNMVYVIKRGEIENAYKVAYSGVYTMSLVHREEWTREVCTDLVIKQMLFVGSFVVVAMSTNVVFVMENFDISYVIENDAVGGKCAEEIHCVMHPSTYINKILITYSSKMQMYNIVSRKVIYTFNICDVRQAVQTPLIDVVALLSESEVSFFNLRLDKEMFKIKIPGIRHLSFRTDAAPHLICCSENAYVFELSRLKCVAELKGVYWACFLPGQRDFISASQNLEFYSMEGYRPVLVHRRVLFSEAECMDIVSNKHIVLMQKSGVIGMNIYKDDQTFRFSCKDLRGLNKVRVDKEIVVSSDSGLFLLDFDKKNGKLISTSSNFEFELIGFEHPFCVYGREELKVLNVGSLRIVSRISVLRNIRGSLEGLSEQHGGSTSTPVSDLNILDIAIIHKKLYISTHDKVLVASFEGSILNELCIAGVQRLRRHGSILFLKKDTKVVLAEVNTLKLIREFEYNVLDYFVTKDQKLVGMITPELLLIDVASGQILERVCFEKTPRSVAFSLNQDFLFVLFSDGTVCSYYNNAVLNEYLAQPRSLFTHDVEFKKSMDQNYLIEIFEKDFVRAQKVLDEVDLSKHEYGQIGEFITFYNKRWEEVEDMCLETIGIVEFHKRVRGLV